MVRQVSAECSEFVNTVPLNREWYVLITNQVDYRPVQHELELQHNTKPKEAMRLNRRRLNAVIISGRSGGCEGVMVQVGTIITHMIAEIVERLSKLGAIINWHQAYQRHLGSKYPLDRLKLPISTGTISLLLQPQSKTKLCWEGAMVTMAQVV